MGGYSRPLKGRKKAARARAKTKREDRSRSLPEGEEFASLDGTRKTITEGKEGR